MKTSATHHFSLFTFHCDERKAARGFTLIELLMVIAIIGIISTLAVNKVGGVREAAARKVSLANQIAVERAVGSYLAGGGRLNRLDSLVYTQGDTTSPWDKVSGLEASGYGFNWNETNYSVKVKGLYLGPDNPSASADAFRADYNAGIAPGLQTVLCPYVLSPSQRIALGVRLGLYHVMGHNEYAGDPASWNSYANSMCGDGSYVESREGRNPNESGCVAIAVTNTTGKAMALFAVNPTIEAGRAIYRACGQELMKLRKDNETYTQADAAKEANEKGGPLIALGLGPSASIIGKADAGLESAPFATYPSRIYYANYILLFRLRPVGADIVPEFAGVIDPCGNTVRTAREIIKNL